jgi:hypothetical protein
MYFPISRGIFILYLKFLGTTADYSIFKTSWGWGGGKSSDHYLGHSISPFICKAASNHFTAQPSRQETTVALPVQEGKGKS